MRLTIGSSFTLDGDAASSTITTASLRLDFNLPFVPTFTQNELRINGLRVYIEATTEANLATALNTLIAAFLTASGKTITFYNTTGTALFTVDSTVYPECVIEYRIDASDVSAKVTFDIVARIPGAPVSGGAGDITGQRGEIEYELEVGPNGITAATATAEFGPTTGVTARANASAWLVSLYGRPPALPAHFPASRMTFVHAIFRPIRMPNQASLTDSSYDPVLVTAVFREVYSGLSSVPAMATDINVNSNMANEEAMDVRSGEANGPAIITLQGYFTVITEAPTGVISTATKVGRAEILNKAQEVYDAIEADFLTVHGAMTPLIPLGNPEIDLGLDNGRVTFSRIFSTTYVRSWRERTRVSNVDPVVINRDYSGRDIVHHGNGGPIVTLTHSLRVESIETPRAYNVPQLGANWVRLDKGQDVTITSKLRGGTLIYITEGSSSWRYVNPAARGPSDQGTQQGKVLTFENLGNGTL